MDFPSYLDLKIPVFTFSCIILVVTTLAITMTKSTSIQQVVAFQQIAGPVIINVTPGETKPFSWGLLAGDNETSILSIYADGNGSEFLSFPESYRLTASKTNNITGNVTIPPNHTTNTTLTPIIHSTISENDTNVGGGNAVNVELSKILSIIIGGNKTQTNLTSVTTNQGPQIGLISKGTINSLITTPATKWIASGNWSMNVNNGNVTFFETNMTWNNINGTNAHSHEFQNFKVSNPISLNQSDNNISLKGLMDVGTNNRVVWKDIPSTIDINGKKTISISVDDNMTNNHFASQPILGVVSSFLVCSDIPGPNMEVLAPCSQPNSPTSSISPLSDEALTGVQPILPTQPASIPANVSEQLNQEGSQGQTSTTPSLQTGGVPTNNFSSNLSNTTVNNFLTYENATLGLIVGYPSDWIIENSNVVNPLVSVELFPKSDDDSVFRIMVHNKEPFEQNIETIANDTVSNYEKNIKDFQSILYNPNSALSGNPAYQLDGTYIDESSIKRHLTETGVQYNNKIYILQFNTTESKSPNYLSTVGEIVQSLQFIPNAETPKSVNQNLSSTEPTGACEKVPITFANASGFETDPKDYNPPDEAIDKDLKTWWANKGVPSWLQIDLEKPTVLCTIEIAWNKGNERTYDFVIATFDNGNIFTDVYNGTSSGDTESYEKYDIANSPLNVKNIKLNFISSSSKSGWVSIKEINVIGR
jgi:hypothetical protein